MPRKTINRCKPADLHRLSLHVDGMKCGSCVARVEGALRGVAGVVDADVNFATASATVDVKGDVSDASLVDALRGAGYEATLDDGFEPGGLDRATQVSAEHFARQRTAFAWAAGGWLLLMLGEQVAEHAQPWQWASAAVCAALLACPAGRLIVRDGVRALVRLAPDMDALIVLGVGAAFLYSVAALLFGGSGPLHFHAVAMILMFITGGRFLESRAKHEAGRAVAALVAKMPRVASCLRDGEWHQVSVEHLRRGDHVRVVPDGVIPVDGYVLSGASAVDESAVTGESMPRSRGVGDDVWGGTIVREGIVVIEATGVGRDTAIGRIVDAVRRAQSGKSRFQRIADRVAGVFVPIVIGCAVLTIGLWLMAGALGWLEAESARRGWAWAMRCAVAVFVIACPCAMGLATPVAVQVATGRAALAGILVRSPGALETLGRARLIVFDKTGTLTTGEPVVAQVFDEPVGPATLDARELLQVAASADQFSPHPLARAIVAKAAEAELPLTEPTSFEAYAGRGVSAVIGGRTVLVGSSSFLEEHGVDLRPVDERVERLVTGGWTVVAVAIDGTCAGVIGLRDQVRRNAAVTVQALADLGCRVAMITGDAPESAQAVAAEAGIHEVYARVMPEEKLAEVRRLQADGEIVAFVGDGTNDAPAITAADAGIAFAAGTDIANQAAGITLVGSDLAAVATAVRLARRSVVIIKQNLFWAFFYNTIAIPLAATGSIPPGLAAGAMMMSSISVLLNSLRLRKA